MPKKIKYDSDSDSDKPKKKNKTTTKKTKKGITIKNKNKNKIIININSGKKGKKEKVQKIIQTQTRPPISMGTTLISGNPIDKNYEIELSKLRNQINESKREIPTTNTISSPSNILLNGLSRGALGVGNYILEKAKDTEGYVIKKVTNRIDNLESVADTIGSKIIHKAADGTISLFEKSINGLISLGSYTLSKTGEGLNILLKNVVDSYSTPLTDPTLQQTNLMDTVDDPTLHQTNLMGNNDDDDLPPIEVSSDVDPNDLNQYGYPNIRPRRSERLIPPPINLNDLNDKDDDDSVEDVQLNVPVRIPQYYSNINVSNIEGLMGIRRDRPSFKTFLATNGINYDDIKNNIDIGSKKDAAIYIRQLILDKRNQEASPITATQIVEPETNENQNDESFSLQDLTLSQMMNNNPDQTNTIALITPSQDNSPIFRTPEESEALLSSYYQPEINENDQNEEPPEMSSLIHNDIDSEIIPIVAQPPEQAEEEPGQTAKPKRGRPKLSEDEKLKKEQDKLIIQQVKKAEAEAKRKNKPKSTFGSGRK